MSGSDWRRELHPNSTDARWCMYRWLAETMLLESRKWETVKQLIDHVYEAGAAGEREEIAQFFTRAAEAREPNVSQAANDMKKALFMMAVEAICARGQGEK